MVQHIRVQLLLSVVAVLLLVDQLILHLIIVVSESTRTALECVLRCD